MLQEHTDENVIYHVFVFYHVFPSHITLLPMKVRFKIEGIKANLIMSTRIKTTLKLRYCIFFHANICSYLQSIACNVSSYESNKMLQFCHLLQFCLATLHLELRISVYDKHLLQDVSVNLSVQIIYINKGTTIVETSTLILFTVL